MNGDIRISTSLLQNPKYRRLRRSIPSGEPAALEILFALWSFVATNRPKGVLTGMEPSDVADAVEWKGNPEDLIQLLHETTRFLDCGDECRNQSPGSAACSPGRWFVVHDWREHNPYAAEAEERAERARRNAHARWCEQRGAPCADRTCKNYSVDNEHASSMQPASESHASSMQPASESHVKSNAPTILPNQPSIQPAQRRSAPGVTDRAEWFESAWTQYPKKVGRKEAIRRFKSSVKNEEDFRRFLNSLQNFIAHHTARGTEQRYIPNGSTWFGNWEDEEWQTPPKEPSARPRSAPQALKVVRPRDDD